MAAHAEGEPEKVNFRVAGRLPKGHIRKAAASGEPGQTRPAIPSKLETILYKGDRENLGFGSKDLRFDLASGPAENPGPGHYGEGSKGVAEILQDKLSWSKRGTGSFASVTRRFPQTRYVGGPGPGAYGRPALDLPGNEKLPSASFTKKLDLPSRVGPSPQGPGPGEYKLKPAISDSSAGVAAFKSRSKRGVDAKAADGPGPGQYAIRSKSAPVQPRDCKAAFAPPTSRAADYVRLHKDLPVPSLDADPDREFMKPRVPPAVAPGPGYYGDVAQIQSEYTACVKGNAAFVEDTTKVARKAPVQTPGPGTYTLPSAIDGSKGIKSAFQWQGVRGVSGSDVKPQAPGPAYYDQKTHEEKKSFHLNIRRKWV